MKSSKDGLSLILAGVFIGIALFWWSLAYYAESIVVCKKEKKTVNFMTASCEIKHPLVQKIRKIRCGAAGNSFLCVIATDSDIDIPEQVRDFF